MHTKSLISILFAGLVVGAVHAGPEEVESGNRTDLNLTLLDQARQAAGDPLSPFYWESDYYNFAGFWVPTMSPHADRAADRAAIRNPVFAPRYDANHYQLFQPHRKAPRIRDERPSRRPMFSASSPGSQTHLRSVAGDFRHQERERPIRRSRGSSARMERPDKAHHVPTRKE